SSVAGAAVHGRDTRPRYHPSSSSSSRRRHSLAAQTEARRAAAAYLPARRGRHPPRLARAGGQRPGQGLPPRRGIAAAPAAPSPGPGTDTDTDVGVVPQAAGLLPLALLRPVAARGQPARARAAPPHRLHGALHPRRRRGRAPAPRPPARPRPRQALPRGRRPAARRRAARPVPNRRAPGGRSPVKCVVEVVVVVVDLVAGKKQRIQVTYTLLCMLL
ncbi:hypothetical protein GGR56DRAFT_657877, partial [Xylariaceae sp. FL0804]